MYTVTVYDKSKKMFRTYRSIHSIKYFDLVDDWVTVSGDAISSHQFPMNCTYQLLSETAPVSPYQSGPDTHPKMHTLSVMYIVSSSGSTRKMEQMFQHAVIFVHKRRMISWEN